MGVMPPSNLMPTLNILQAAGVSGVPDATVLGSQSIEGPIDTPDLVGEGSDLVYVANGLPPIPKKIFEKIKNWQYVNLVELSTKSAKGREEERQFLQQCDGKVLLIQLMENIKRKSTEFYDIISWVEAYGTLVAIAGKSDSASIPELMAYMSKVIRAARVRGSQWQEYDRAYRRKAAAKGVRCWSQHDPDLWDRYITGPSQMPVSTTSYPNYPTGNYQRSDPIYNRHSPYQKPRTAAPPNQWKKSVCFSHNFDKGGCVRTSNGAPCQFTHVCYVCGQGDHKRAD